MGTVLQQRGLSPQGRPELLNLTEPELLDSVYKEYIAAGSQVIYANTFGANGLKLAKTGPVSYTHLDVYKRQILAGTLGMLQRKPRERASSGWGWLPWAVLSAVCASLTSILGKVGMTGVDSYVGTAIRNMVVLAMAWALVLGLGLQREISTLNRKNWGFLAVSGVSTGLSWMFYYRALQEGPASVVAPIDKLSILVTVGFSCLVLRERLSRRAAAGLLVLTCGTLLLLL